MNKNIINRSGGVNYDKGLYEIKNLDKYIGNPLECRYLSSWERKFNTYLDHKDVVKKWGSELESYAIPYKDMNGKWHKYYPDYYIEFLNPQNPLEPLRIIAEIKPYNEIFPKFIKIDKKTGNEEIDRNYIKKLKTHSQNKSFEYQLETYKKNRMKWEYARKYCKERYMEFWLIHEKWLKSKKIL